MGFFRLCSAVQAVSMRGFYSHESGHYLILTIDVTILHNRL